MHLHGVKTKMKKILILGASSDIGVELTKIFLKNNWEVLAHYNSNSLNLKRIKNKKLKLFKLNFLNDNKTIENTIRFLKYKKIDSFVNLTGYIDNNSFYNFSIDQLVNTIKVNTIIPYFIIQKIIKNMLKYKFGRILLTSSIGAKYGGGKTTFNYSLSKKANQFIPGEYKFWARKNVLINSLMIGVTDTKIHKKISKKNLNKRKKLIPINRFATTIEISKYIFYLLSEENTFITGENLSISGGE